MSEQTRLSTPLIETFLSRVEDKHRSQGSRCDGWGFPGVVLDFSQKFGRESISTDFAEVLQQSRTFLSPDCTDAMADNLGVDDLLLGLRGSLMQSGPSLTSIEALRAQLRQHIRSAWSQEAVKRGVLHAKAGEIQQALACYSQALDLDKRNTDALVARGAALANAQQWQRASDDLETALQLLPSHHNATAYLAAVKFKAASCGIELSPPSGMDGLGGQTTAAVNAERPQFRKKEFLNEERQEQEEMHEFGIDAQYSRGGNEILGRSCETNVRSKPNGNTSSPGTQSSESNNSGGCLNNANAPALQLQGAVQTGGSSQGQDAGALDMESALNILTKHYKQSRHKQKHKSKRHRNHKEKKSKKKRSRN